MKENFTHLQSFIEGIVKEAVESALTLSQQLSAEDSNNSSEQEKDEILNADQAAEFLHLAKQTLYTLTSKRRIPFYKNGKKILFKRNELQEWMDSGRKSKIDSSEKSEFLIRKRRG